MLVGGAVSAKAQTPTVSGWDAYSKNGLLVNDYEQLPVHREIFRCRYLGEVACRPQNAKIDSNVRRLLRPNTKQQVVVLVDAATLREAEKLIEACEHCNDEDAQIPFDNILDASLAPIRA